MGTSGGHHQHVLQAGVFPEGLKEIVVVLLLKKSTLDTSNPANYHSDLNLSFLRKIIEREQ